MAFVTRCPYCRSVWLLPDRETAERGPVMCADCSRSFNAAAEILEVPDELFPNRGPGVSKVTSVAPPPKAEKKISEIRGMMDGFEGRTGQKAKVSAAPAAGIVPRRDGPAAPAGKAAVVPAEEKKAAAEAGGPGSSGLGRIVPGETRTAAREAPAAAVKPAAAAPAQIVRPRRRKSGAGSVFLALILLAAIAAVAAVVFNQQVMQYLPQSKPVFNEVCRRVTCPGFYLEDIRAFVVSRTNLRSLDESGNYVLEITLMNGSGIAQKVPNLEVELVDGTDATLLHRTLRPSEYLDDPKATKSIAPNRPVTVRFNMQTNVIPARCIVTPVY